MKPDVKVIHDQSIVTNSTSIDSWEAEQLLRKYGYTNTNNSDGQIPTTTENDLTFEEMVAKEEERIRIERLSRKNVDPNIETRYSTDEETGFSFKVEIKSDMPIPKY